MGALGLASLATVETADAALAPGTSICQYSATEGWCKNEQFRQCPGKQEACTTILQSGFQNAYAGKVDRPRYQYLDDTNAIVGGKVDPKWMADTKVSNVGGTSSYAGREQRAQAEAQKASVTPSYNYTRADVDITSTAVSSCAEYVYEKYYTYMRFIDAANSCKQDDGCVVDMAYATNQFGPRPSNIADRPIAGRSKSGLVPLEPIPLSSGVVPKNGFYAGAVLLTPKLRAVLGATHPTWQPMLDEIAARAYAGSHYYKWGSVSVYGVAPVKVYANEWDFHRAMRAATQALPLAEARANRTRTERFEEQFANWAATAYCHGLSGADPQCLHLPVLRQKGVLETIGGDPWIRTHILGDKTLRSGAVSLALQGKALELNANGTTLSAIDVFQVSTDIGGLQVPISGASNLVKWDLPTDGQVEPLPLPNPDPQLDPTPLWADGYGLDLNNEWTMDPPAVDVGTATPRLDCAVEATKSSYRLLACQATNAMLDEIARDNTSCFDKGYAGCDWAPAMFAERFHRSQQYMTQRAQDYESCMRWTSNAFSALTTTEKEDFKAVEKVIRSRRQAFEDFPAPRILSGGRVSKFGQSKSEYKEVGDSDSFGGGYSYNVGWSSTPVRNATTQAICRMDFTTDASFKAWGTALSIRKDFVDVGAHLSVNQGDSGEAKFTRRLRVGIAATPELITDPDEPVDINLATHVDLGGTEEDIEVLNTTFPLAYGFYVNVTAGVELSTGVTFVAQANLPPKGDCTSAAPLGALAQLNPYATASLYGSTSGGWLGIVEAGLEAELDVVKVEMPVTAFAQVEASANPKLKYQLSGKMALSSLSGRVEACGCFLVFCGCKEITSWPGVKVASGDLFEPVVGEADLLAF